MSVIGFKKSLDGLCALSSFILDVCRCLNFAKPLSIHILLDYSILYSLRMLHYTLFAVVFDCF